MKIKDLKKLIMDVPEGMSVKEWNELTVLISPHGEFDGLFVSPCMEESGFAKMGIDEDSEETEPSFVIVPCNFFKEKSEPHIHELN